jgi:exodeoxyribonuclease VII large subunit
MTMPSGIEGSAPLPADAVPGPSAVEALTVAQALGLAHKAVAAATPDGVWVVGTVSGLMRSRADHLYFHLSDHDPDGSTPAAVLPVVVFARDSGGITRTLDRAGVELANGLAVRLRGRLSVYAPKGSVQLVASAIDPTVTVGEGTIRKRQLLATLEREGLLARQQALPLPLLPRVIGLVGPAGAGAADVVSVIEGSGFAVRVLRFPAATSGVGAPHAIAAAVAGAARAGVDLIIVTRGGGPASDLVAFDSEPVARSICGVEVPVVTALGHSTDRTVADACARMPAISPTDAATVVVDLLAGAEEVLLLEATRVAHAARAALGRAVATLESHAAAISAVRTQTLETASARASADRARRTSRVVMFMAAVVVGALLIVVAVLLAKP